MDVEVYCDGQFYVLVDGGDVFGYFGCVDVIGVGDVF